MGPEAASNVAMVVKAMLAGAKSVAPVPAGWPETKMRKANFVSDAVWVCIARHHKLRVSSVVTPNARGPYPAFIAGCALASSGVQWDCCH